MVLANDNIFLPHLAEITAIQPETGDTSTFALRMCDPEVRRGFIWKPGQFVEVSVFGSGEAPFGFASSWCEGEDFKITVRSTGEMTRALHNLSVGDQVGVRGPFGNGFSLEDAAGRNILIVGGGIGLPPLRPLLMEALAGKEKFGKITVLYGARTPADLVYKPELEQWKTRSDMEFLVTVDVAENNWKGNVGVVGSLFPKIEIDPTKTAAYVCGPPIMIRFVVLDLVKLGLEEEWIITTLERHMRCGAGKCNHCLIGDKYVCLDGPVFNCQQIKGLLEPA
ncbi:MAG: hydrogenase [Armatimonadetes bacterium]|nr:hydrogenase [Armatimonadota bacterium]NIO74589.1 hydrogenase [Armatimonadota bacterium]NIO96544.1 hydrogenase [Armatimonadota bacterium]